jgi:hypothetical protein
VAESVPELSRSEDLLIDLSSEVDTKDAMGEYSKELLEAFMVSHHEENHNTGQRKTNKLWFGGASTVVAERAIWLHVS